MEVTKDSWSKSEVEDFVKYLQTFSKGEEKGVWERRIVNTLLPCIAVPSPIIKDFANKIFKGNYEEFLSHLKWVNHSCSLLEVSIISKIKDFDSLKPHLEKVCKNADNWSTIDSFKPKFTVENMPKFMDFAEKILTDDYPFARRMGLIIMLKLAGVEEFSDRILNNLATLKNETHYYVNMGASWVLTEMFTKQRDKTLKFLEENASLFNSFVLNKFVSKCHDSFRISDADKIYLNKFKQPK